MARLWRWSVWMGQQVSPRHATLFKPFSLGAGPNWGRWRSFVRHCFVIIKSMTPNHWFHCGVAVLKKNWQHVHVHDSMTILSSQTKEKWRVGVTRYCCCDENPWISLRQFCQLLIYVCYDLSPIALEIVTTTINDRGMRLFVPLPCRLIHLAALAHRLMR